MHVYDIVKNYKNIRITLDKHKDLKLVDYFAIYDCYIDLCKDIVKNLFICINPICTNQFNKIYRNYIFRWPRDRHYFMEIKRHAEYARKEKMLITTMNIIMNDLSMSEKYGLK